MRFNSHKGSGESLYRDNVREGYSASGFNSHKGSGEADFTALSENYYTFFLQNCQVFVKFCGE